MIYEPVGFRPVIEDVYSVRLVTDLLEDHKADPVLRLDVRPNTLVIMCLQALAKTFSTSTDLAPVILRIIPHFNRDLFLHIIPTNAPLTITIPNIKSEVYWKRCCQDKWPKQVNKLKEKNYKQLFSEKYLAEVVENIDPGFEDYEEIKDLCILLHPYIMKLQINSLKAAKKKSGTAPLDCHDVEVMPNRLDLRRVVVFLPKLVELDLCFGMDNPVQVSAIRQAILLEAEIENLGEAIILSKILTVLRISTCCFKANDLAILYHYLIESNVMDLKIENCFLGNSGAQIAALLIKNHPVLLKLCLKDNDIGPDGGYALAYALTHDHKSSLRSLDLTMNPIGDEAGTCLAKVLAYHPTLKEMRMSGTRLGEASGNLFAKAIDKNHGIRNLDLSCNIFTRDNAINFLSALQTNYLIDYLDLRSCGFEHETLQDIKEMLFENREAKRSKMLSKSPKRRVRVRHLKQHLDHLDDKNKAEPLIFDPIPAYGSHRTSSLTLSDHGQLTLSTIDSTSSESTVLDQILCPDHDETISELKILK